MSSTSSTKENKEVTEERVLNVASNLITSNLDKIKICFVIFALFVINLFAVSISLQCNRNRGIFSKLISAIFAFMFGMLYILVNYYMYRIVMNKYPCKICSDNPFPF